MTDGGGIAMSFADVTLGVVSPDRRQLTVNWSDGGQSVFHAVWLRDNCPCPECRHEVSGQRLLDTASIPRDIFMKGARPSGNADAAEIVWDGGHVSRFAFDWLHEHAYPHGRSDGPSAPTLWDAEIAGRLPEARYGDVTTSDVALRDWLAAADDYGFALLHGVPTEPGQILRVVEMFGYVRETNYGRLFDVKSVVNPSNLAFTGMALGAHTDNPYRDPTPSLQLLHCLSSSASGGENTLVDGFRVAEDLRQTGQAAFDLLARQPVRFTYRDDHTELTTVTTIISVAPWDEITAVHFNNRSKAPIARDEALVEPFYDAYRTFARLLADPRFEIRLALTPGDLLIMDNLRVLHGRTGYSAAGSRHLQGCYADRDGLRSRLAVLNRSAGTEAAVRS
jgi:gamma-butyrobetaine dioxygenase